MKKVRDKFKVTMLAKAKMASSLRFLRGKEIARAIIGIIPMLISHLILSEAQSSEVDTEYDREEEEVAQLSARPIRSRNDKAVDKEFDVDRFDPIDDDSTFTITESMARYVHL